MKIVLSETFKEQIGADSLQEWEDRVFGKPGSYKRYLHDREELKFHIKEVSISFLCYPLKFFPWGHIAANFWSRVLFETPYNVLDGLAFSYISDAYVVGFRDALRGKRHNWPVKFDPDVKKPYLAYYKSYPLWLITRLVWPQFLNVYRTRKENYYFVDRYPS